MYVFVAEIKTDDPWYGFNLVGIGANFEAAQALCQDRFSDYGRLVWAEGSYRQFDVSGFTELPCWYGEDELDEEGYSWFADNNLRIRVMEVSE